MLKKFFWTLLFGCVLLSFGGCKPMEKGVKSLEGKEGVFAVISTAKGDIVLELYYKQTPLTVTNFVGLSEGTLNASKGKPFYDGLKFHRVIEDFMIQGGDPRGNGTGGPGYQFPDEIVDGLNFTGAGILAMANAGPGTNGSQFFITHVETPWLNGHHTIFGHVVDKASQDVVNKIAQNDVIKSVKIYRQGAEAQKFSATQADFDNLYEKATLAAREAQRKALEEQQRALEKSREELKKTEAEVAQKYASYSKDKNGIYFTITKEGSGEKCGSGKYVTTEYKGYFLDGTVFDGSAKFIDGGHEALDFTTDAGQMIPGFDVMVQDMKLGEVRTVILPPSMAYGERGAGGVIPPNSYIAFDIELVKIR